MLPLLRTGCLVLALQCAIHAGAQQPAEPVDISPINGEVYYLINQLSGLQLNLNDNSTSAGVGVVIDARSFTSLSQRWAFTKMPSGYWAISNMQSSLCLDSSSSSGTPLTVENPCLSASTTQQWSPKAASNGYVTLVNEGTGLALDVLDNSEASGAATVQTPLKSSPTQSQQWLLRPAFFRGIDGALLEKQEAERVAGDYPWWQDAGKAGDVLQMLKDHGVNLVRIRPTSEPPYTTYTPATCTGNGCYAETDSADISLAKRAKQLGMSIELTLFFDGGSSSAIPGAWSSDTLAQAESALYSYVKAEVEAYRSAGVMPDMVTIGNEVDTGFLGSLGSPTGSNFTPFASLEKQGMQAIADASSETTTGPALPAPIRCIHITPNWSLTSFFGYVNSNGIPYDAMCQSYYPIYHGPLTAAQAESSNPNDQPIEETALTSAATSFGKPIFLIETAEHYENGFDVNDPWYPATVAGQRQFLIDLNSAMKGLPDNLGMGIEYWDPEGVNMPKSGGGFTNGDGEPNAIYTWNGLTLFDNADTSGSTKTTAANYSAILEGADALGGKLDSTLAYKLVNTGNGEILETTGTATSDGLALSAGTNTGGATLSQQWKITSNNDGYFQIASLNAATDSELEALDTDGLTTKGSLVYANTADTGKASQEWNVVTTGGGSYAIVNRASGLVLAASGTSSGALEQQAPNSTDLDWIAPASTYQQWQIVPVHITESAKATALHFASTTEASKGYGTPVGTLQIEIEDNTGAIVSTPSATVTLTIHGPGSYVHTSSAVSAAGMASFNLDTLILKTAGVYTMTASAPALASATVSLNVTKAVLKVAAQNATRAYGAANPAFAYTVTGFVDGDTQSVVRGSPQLSTTATASSTPGSYPISIQTGTLAAANYTFSLAAATLTVTSASTLTTLSTSATKAFPGKDVTLTATVTSASKPLTNGLVSFMEGYSVLATVAVSSSGVATLTTATLAAGNDTITAKYNGSADFGSSSSTAVTVSIADFALSASDSNITVNAGSSASTDLTITPLGGYAGTIKLNCTTMLAGVTCSFNPASYAATGSSAALKGVVTIVASTSAKVIRPAFRHNSLGVLYAEGFAVPSGLFILIRRRRLNSHLRRGSLWSLPLMLIMMSSLIACGAGGSRALAQSAESMSGTVTVTASGASGPVTQSVKLNVTIP